MKTLSGMIAAPLSRSLKRTVWLMRVEVIGKVCNRTYGWTKDPARHRGSCWWNGGYCIKM